jgi:CheY-like chemotaxis protein
MAKKVLIVDDEVEIRTLLETVFTKEGYEVHTADSAESAIELLENVKIYVMFLDLNLPGMNGIDLCAKIRKDIPMAIIYAITGYASLFDIANCRDAGFDDYFTKPVSLNNLKQVTDNAFQKLDREGIQNSVSIN